MATVTAAQVYRAALASGFNKAESVIMTVTAELENSYRTDTTTGNGGGLLQFEPGTWSGTKVSCDKGSLSCQMAAARKLTSGNFVASWFQNWLTPELQQGHMTVSDYAAKVSGVEQSLGVGSSGASALLSLASGGSGSGFPDPGGIASGVGSAIGGVGSGISSGIQSVIGIPGKIVSGAVGDIGSGIASGLTDVGKRLLPYLLIVGGIIIVFWLMLQEIGKHEAASGNVSSSTSRMPVVPVE